MRPFLLWTRRQGSIGVIPWACGAVLRHRASSVTADEGANVPWDWVVTSTRPTHTDFTRGRCIPKLNRRSPGVERRMRTNLTKGWRYFRFQRKRSEHAACRWHLLCAPSWDIAGGTRRV